MDNKSEDGKDSMMSIFGMMTKSFDLENNEEGEHMLSNEV